MPPARSSCSTSPFSNQSSGGIHEVFQKRHSVPRVDGRASEHSSGAVSTPQPLQYWHVWVDGAGATHQTQCELKSFSPLSLDKGVEEIFIDRLQDAQCRADGAGRDGTLWHGSPGLYVKRTEIERRVAARKRTAWVDSATQAEQKEAGSWNGAPAAESQ